MLRPDKTRILLMVGGIGIIALAGAVGGRFLGLGTIPSTWSSVSTLLTLDNGGVEPVQTLGNLSPEELTDLARQSSSRVDRNRARYLLAQQLLPLRPADALEWIDGLEKDYPVLAPHILSLRAQLQGKLGNTTAATQTWQILLQDHGTSPVAAEALSALAQTDSRYRDRLIQEWPAHPLAVELALNTLEDPDAATPPANAPDRRALMLLVARHGLYTYQLPGILDRLVDQYSAELTPADWAAIGFAHWEKLNYPKAAKAYAKAEATPLHLYRAARSFQIAEQPESAITYYKKLVATFPQAPETAQGLAKLAPLLEERDLRAALPYWDQLYKTFPDSAAAALLGKAETLSLLGSQVSADQARQSVLSQYGDSDAAAELRWRQAQAQVKTKNLDKAAALAQTIQDRNPHSPIAPEAGFWAGRWWQTAGNNAKAKAVFEQVLRDHPDSYFAWRSAVFLNLPVGDFQSVWQVNPAVQVDPAPADLPAGSEALQELYQLGQYGDAWRLWQVELTNPVEPTVAEQFTDGLIRIGIGDYLDGIFMLDSLSFRTDPAEQTAVQDLHHGVIFWHNLYPFPFQDIIETWSSQRQVNPLLVTALMRQESRFMPGIESVAGAMGLMQVMPSTGDWIAGQVGLTGYDLREPDTNVSLGTWYLNYTHEEWQGNSMLAVASYNAGPGNVADWLDRYSLEDADLFVEDIPFGETQGYVKSVFENYWNYLRLYNPEISDLVGQYSPDHAKITLIHTDQSGKP